MAATTTDSRDFDVQVFNDIVTGVFAQKDALVGGSRLASSGAILVNDSLTSQPDWIGNEVTVPYFGILGEFADNPEDSAAVPKALKTTHEKATLGRSSLAFEVTRWARLSSVPGGDPYLECARQMAQAATREMDRLCIAAAMTSPLVKDVYSASSPVQLDWDLVTDGRAMWGDEQEDIVGMVVHSRVESGLRKLRDANGRPLLLDSMVSGNNVMTFNGIPLTISDKAPLTGSSMSSVTEAGTTPPDVTLTGTPTGAWNLRLKVIVGGARGTATFQFSTDGGNTWSATMLTAASVPLIDTAADSLVGNNGQTGLTAAFENATFNVDNTWSSNAILKATSLIFQRNAMAFWFNRAALQLQTDKDILKDNDVAAMHMYRVAHMYRRRRGGTKPGVVRLTHNVPGFTG